MGWQWLLVAAGGALGALARHGVQSLGFLDSRPWAYTLAANVSGCLLIGVAWALFQHYGVGQAWRLLVITGCLGGYTTFSSFSLDTMKLLEAGEGGQAALYVFLTLAAGLGTCAGALWATRRLLGA